MTVAPSYDDPHRTEQRLQATLGRIAKDPKIPTQDKKLIFDYIEHTQAQGHSAGRRNKLAWSLHDLARHMPCSFRAAKRREIEKVVAWINTSTYVQRGKTKEYSASTRSDFKKVLKQFYRFVRFGNIDQTNPYPPEVAWIRCAMKLNELKPDDLLDEEEVKKMIDAAPNIRDKAFILTILEAGYRIGELLRMKVGSLTKRHFLHPTRRGVKSLLTISFKGGSLWDSSRSSVTDLVIQVPPIRSPICTSDTHWA